MKNAELISDFINKLVSGDAEAAKAAFSQFCSVKTKAIIGESAVVVEDNRFAELKTLILEFNTNANGPKPIDLQGDRILVNGKEVGRIAEIQFKKDENGVVDVEGDAEGINFISADGSFSKEFNSAEELFRFINQKFLGEENV
jgi:hypothetical protein